MEHDVEPVRNIGEFLGEYLLHPTKIGAIAPSSRFLARAMVAWIDLPRARTVLEYGPGTGAFTSHIIRRMPANAKFAAIELNPRLAQLFRRRHPNLTLVEDSVANVAAICRKLEMESVDCIVCGLPWASFPESLQRRILDQMMAVINPEGQFVTFAYLQGLLLPPGRRFARLLPQYFRHVSKSGTVWLNLPPAFVYQCRR
jgi:phosphatidylethanolamine/phosphatidyl-N-methylethanolamine N-methyltransferase